MESKFPNFLTLVLPLLKPATYKQGEVLMDPILFMREMFFVVSGSVIVTKDSRKEKQVKESSNHRKPSFNRWKNRRVQIHADLNDDPSSALNETKQEPQAVLGPGNLFGACLVLIPDNLNIEANVEVRAFTDTTIMYLQYNEFQSLNLYYPQMMKYWIEQLKEFLEEELQMFSWHSNDVEDIQKECPFLYECFLNLKSEEKLNSFKNEFHQNNKTNEKGIESSTIPLNKSADSQKQLIEANEAIAFV